MTIGLIERTEPVLVGVVGHRFLTDEDELTAGIDEALDAIESAFPNRSLTAVTSLAEGADQLGAQRILDRNNASLAVILPFPQLQVFEDFQDPQSRTGFAVLLSHAQEISEIPPHANKNDAYETAGQEILKRIEVLLALWDGQVEQGRGGTGAVVNSARSMGLPIAWVHAGNRSPGTNQATTLGDDQGRVTFENFPTLPACRQEE